MDKIIARVPLSVVVIGGGTGNSTVLSGLKLWVQGGLSAIVNTFDDGGGTGKLREEYGGIAVGDMRQCARAMSNLSPDALAVLEGRFGEGSGLSDMNVQGQTLGNLLIHSVLDRYPGDSARALATYGELYRVKGRVLPVSLDSRRLRLELPDGQVVIGEHAAEETEIASFKGVNIGYEGGNTPQISEAAEAAIATADMVVLAPGDLYTSIGPNLAVRGMKEALSKAATVVMVANLMNRNRHTVGFTTLDYAVEYERLIGVRVGDSKIIHHVLYNTGELDAYALGVQAARGSHPVGADHQALLAADYSPVGKDLLSSERVVLDPNDELAKTRSDIRHDPQKVAHALMGIYFGNNA